MSRTIMFAVLRLYLDQRDLIDLAEAPTCDQRRALEQLVAAGRIQAVLSFSHIIETWKYGKASGRAKVASFADSLQPAWILFRPELFGGEASSAFLRFLGHIVSITWRPATVEGSFETPSTDPRQHVFVPLRPSSFESHFPRAQPAEGSADRSFAGYLRVLEETPTVAEALAKIHETYATQSGMSKQRFSTVGNDTALLAYYFEQGWAGPPVPAVVYERFLATVRLRDCPGLFVYAKLRNAILRDTLAHSAASEMVDVAHAAALPYCDAFSTDKRIWDYIRRSRVHAQIFPAGGVGRMTVFKKLADALRWLEEESRPERLPMPPHPGIHGS